MNKAWRRGFLWCGLVLSVAALPVGAGWLGDSLADLLRAVSGWPSGQAWYSPVAWFSWLASIRFAVWPDEAHVHAATALGGLVAFGLGLWFLHRHRSRLLFSDARILPPHPSPAADRTVLILGLSPLAADRLADAEAALRRLPIWDVARDENGVKDLMNEAEAEGGNQRKTDLTALATIPWQQALRMIWAHAAAANRREPLRAILILTSRDMGQPGSEGQAGAFIRLVEDCLAQARREGRTTAEVSPEVRNVTPGGIDFEDYTGVVEASNRAITIAEKEFGASHQQICVDITPGLKIYSVAAAMVTMNRRSIFGYVTRQGVPRFYDARISIGAALGEG